MTENEEFMIKEWLEQLLNDEAEDAEGSVANSKLWGDDQLAETQRTYANILRTLANKVDQLIELGTEE